MNDNTILRIKVPAHLYESVKAQLTLTEAKKGGHNYGAGMEVVKEKKMSIPPDGMKKVKDDKKKGHSLEELKAAYKKLSEKIEEMETGDHKINEAKDKEKVERFEVIVHKNGKKVSGKDYPNRESANSAFEKASKDLENDVYLNDNIGRHIKIRKAKKKEENK
jgi:hypothetical protein